MSKPIFDITQNDRDRFLKKVSIDSNVSNCWVFKNNGRYGWFWLNGSNYLAHRISYYLANNVDPLDSQVCHSCDNPHCVNPIHLWLGTPLDNMQDKEKKGRGRRAYGSQNGRNTMPDRYPKGEDRKTAKLTEQKVKDIRSLYETGGHTYMMLASIYDVSYRLIEGVIKKTRWKHVA